MGYAKDVKEDIVEVGIFRGGTLEGFAQVNNNVSVWGIDLGQRGDAINPVNIYEIWIRKYGNCFIVIGDSMIVGKHWKSPVGFIFIDGDHSRAKEDLEAWYPCITRGGIIAFHDAFIDIIRPTLNNMGCQGLSPIVCVVEDLKLNSDYEYIETVDSTVFFRKK